MRGPGRARRRRTVRLGGGTRPNTADDADPASAIEYEVFLDGSFFSLTPPGISSAFLYTDSGTNTWTVVAVDRAGNSSTPGNPATVTVRSDANLC